MFVGKCKKGEAITSCTAGENHWGDFSASLAHGCGRGQKIRQVMVTCYEPSSPTTASCDDITYVEGTNGADVCSSGHISDAKTCGTAAESLGYSFHSQLAVAAWPSGCLKDA